MPVTQAGHRRSDASPEPRIHPAPEHVASMPVTHAGQRRLDASQEPMPAFEIYTDPFVRDNKNCHLDNHWLACRLSDGQPKFSH